MKITEINNLKAGDKFEYRGEPAEVMWVRAKEPDEKVWVKGNDDKWTQIIVSDKSIGVAFFYGPEKKVSFLVSRIDEKMVREGKFVELVLADYVKA